MQNVSRLLTFLELVTDKHVGSLVTVCALENAQLASAAAVIAASRCTRCALAAQCEQAMGCHVVGRNGGETCAGPAHEPVRALRRPTQLGMFDFTHG